MISEVLKLLGFFRAIVYFLILTNASLNAYLYWNAYKKYKMTWVIKSVFYLHLSIAFSFFFYTLVALINYLDGVSFRYQIIVAFLGFTNLPLLFAIIDFKNASTSDLKKNKSYKFKKK